MLKELRVNLEVASLEIVTSEGERGEHKMSQSGTLSAQMFYIFTFLSDEQINF